MKKNSIKILLASLALALGGSATVGVASGVAYNRVNAETKSNENTVVLNASYRAKLGGEVTPVAPSTGFNFTGLITKGIQAAGTGILSGIGSQIGIMAFNSLLKAIGIDARSSQEKTIDQIQNQLNTLQNDLKQGIVEIKRKVTQLHNETIMNELLEKLSAVQTPVAGKMATMIDLAKKETDDKSDKKELEKEKQTFIEGLNEMKFTKLGGNTLWNEVENLAKSIQTPFSANTSIKLFDLYEEIYGRTETWDYMTIAPRTKFIGYIGSLVNSLCQLATVKATYEMSKLKEGDSNLLDYKTGVNAMIAAVNSLNGELKNELDKLSAIQKKHDEQHLITHRDIVIDKDGNLTVKEGKTVSTRLLPVTTGDNDDNYVSYFTKGDNPIVRYDNGGGESLPVYAEEIYTLNCNQVEDLYKDVVNEYNTYVAVTGSISMKDYLKNVGFTCENKELFDKAKGFYCNIDLNKHKGPSDNWWRTETHRDLRVRYYSFDKADGKPTYATYSTAKQYIGSWFSKTEYSGWTTNELNNYYLVFLSQDQKTIEGKLVKTELTSTYSKTSKGPDYNNQFKGHKEWKGEFKETVTID